MLRREGLAPLPHLYIETRLSIPEASSVQRSSLAADLTSAMSSPRNLYPNTTVFVTCRCVHQSFRLVPKPIVRRIVDFCFGVVSSRYREETGMQFYEFDDGSIRPDVRDLVARPPSRRRRQPACLLRGARSSEIRQT